MAKGTPENVDSRSYRNAGLLLVYIAIGAIVFVLVKALVFDTPLNDAALQQALIAAGVGVTVTCLIVWLLNLLQILPIQEGWSKLLWSVLIASILGNSALVYKRITRESSSSPLLRMVCLKALEVGTAPEVLHPYAIRGNAVYQRGDRISFFGAFSSFALNDAGEFDVSFRSAVEDLQNKKANYWDDGIRANFKKLIADPVRRSRTEEYKKVAPECVGPEILEGAFIYTLPKDAVDGAYLLRLTVHDKVGGAIAEEVLPFEIRGEGRPAAASPPAQLASAP